MPPKKRNINHDDGDDDHHEDEDGGESFIQERLNFNNRNNSSSATSSSNQWCAFNIGDKSENDIERVMIAYLEKYHLQDIRDVLCPPLTLTNDDSIHYSVFIDVLHFMSANIEIGSILLSYPTELIPIFERALIKTQQRHIDKQEVMKEQFKLKTSVHARLHTLPQCSEVTKTSVRSVRSCDANRLISVSGTVIKTGPIKMLEYKKIYVCKKCKKSFDIVADREQFNSITKPTQCPIEDCGGKSFISREDEIVCRDYQEIKIQDKISQLHVGSIPRSILVVLEDDLVDVVKAGDDVILTGVPFRRWKTFKNDTRCGVDMAVWSNHIRIGNEKKSAMNVTEELKSEFKYFWEKYKENPLAGRNLILKSMCPQLFGLYFVKLAVALTIIGGVPMKKNNTRIRGESHLLIVGDPGTGKSQFLKYASKLSPRYVMTNGIGTTSAGLTVMASKESGGDWALEAGALVLADGGVCCIDEFDAIREHDRVTIHEAMEQQTLSIAKAGLVCKLNTRTTVLAACNPKGKYDLEASISVNCALASPLLSRFDIVLVLLDSQDEEWDSRVSSFILNEQQMEEEDSQLWPFDKLRAYISYIKSEYHPQIPPESGRILTEYYRLQRRADRRVAARTTIRLLESLVRLAQAHARLMCRKEVTIQDAVMSVLTVDISSNTSSLLNVSSVLHSNFPDDPDNDYKGYIEMVLYKLGIGQDPRSINFSMPPQTQRPQITQKKATQPVVTTQREQKDEEPLIDDDDDQFDFGFYDEPQSEQIVSHAVRTPTKPNQSKRKIDNQENQEAEDYQSPQKKKKGVISTQDLEEAENDIHRTPSLSNRNLNNFKEHLRSKGKELETVEIAQPPKVIEPPKSILQKPQQQRAESSSSVQFSNKPPIQHVQQAVQQPTTNTASTISSNPPQPKLPNRQPLSNNQPQTLIQQPPPRTIVQQPPPQSGRGRSLLSNLGSLRSNQTAVQPNKPPPQPQQVQQPQAVVNQPQVNDSFELPESFTLGDDSSFLLDTTPTKPSSNTSGNNSKRLIDDNDELDGLI